MKYTDPTEFFKYIIEKSDIDVINDSQKCLALALDLLDSEKPNFKLLKLAFNNNVYKELLKGYNSDSKVKINHINKAIKILTDDCFMDKEKAVWAVGWLASVIYHEEWNQIIGKPIESALKSNNDFDEINPSTNYSSSSRGDGILEVEKLLENDQNNVDLLIKINPSSEIAGKAQKDSEKLNYSDNSSYNDDNDNRYMEEEFTLTHYIDGEVLVIRTNGYLNDLGAEKIDELCSEYLEKSINKIVINFEKSSLINSIGTAILIGVIEAIEEAEGALAFTNLTPTNKKTFELMGLLDFVQLFGKEEEAVAKFKNNHNNYINNNSNNNNGGCFITTAVCDSFNKLDDCYELTMFRAFRDNWLTKEKDGKELIKEYYNNAPKIVDSINSHSNKSEIYLNIWNTYLKDCLKFIEIKKYSDCKDLYIQMVRNLEKEYILK